MKNRIQQLILTATVLVMVACSQQPSIPEAGGSIGSGSASSSSANHTAGSNTRGANMGQGGNVTSTGAGAGGGYQTGRTGSSGHNSGANADMAITPANLNNPRSPLYQKIIYFDYDKATVKPRYRAVLDAHSKLLAQYPNLRVRLEGHADERGTREYNVALSEERAKAVQWSMRSKGVKASQTEIIAYGEERPAVVGDGEKSWAKNRRVEIRYIGR